MSSFETATASPAKQRVAALIHRVRTLVPSRLLPVVVFARIALERVRPGSLANARRQMGFLLAGTDMTPAEVEQCARRYRDEYARRAETRWHLTVDTAMEVEGIEPLLGWAEHDAPVIVEFIHHGPWEGALASVSRYGPLLDIVIGAQMADGGQAFLNQSMAKGMRWGNRTLDVRVGPREILTLLKSGCRVGLASDVVGNQSVGFLGQDLDLAFGVAWMAFRSKAPVVSINVERTLGGTRVVVSEPFHSSDFDSPGDLHRAIMANHEPYVLAWPEAYDQPIDRLQART